MHATSGTRASVGLHAGSPNHKKMVIVYTSSELQLSHDCVSCMCTAARHTCHASAKVTALITFKEAGFGPRTTCTAARESSGLSRMPTRPRPPRFCTGKPRTGTRLPMPCQDHGTHISAPKAAYLMQSKP